MHIVIVVIHETVPPSSYLYLVDTQALEILKYETKISKDNKRFCFLPIYVPSACGWISGYLLNIDVNTAT